MRHAESTLSRFRTPLTWALLPLVAAIVTLTLWELPAANTQVVYSVDGRLIGLDCEPWFGSGYKPRYIRVWDLERRRQLLSFTSLYQSVLLSPRGDTVIVISPAAVSVIDVSTRTMVALEYQDLTGSSALSFSHNGQYCTTQANGMVFVWQVRPWRRVATVKLDFHCSGCAISDDGRQLAMGFETPLSGIEPQSQVEVRDLVTGQRTLLRASFTGGASLAFSPDGRKLVTADNGVRIWDLPTASEQTAFRPSAPMTSAVFSPDSSQLAIQSESRTIVVRLDPNEQLYAFDDVFSWSVVFSPDNQSLAALAFDSGGSVNTLHLATNRRRTIRPASPGYIACSLAVSLAFAVWSLAWFWIGRADRHPYRPLFDLVLVWGILLTGIALRTFGTGSIYDLERPVLQLGSACFFTCLAFIVIWSVLGTARWSVRIPSLFALCALATAPMLVWQDFDWYLWQTIVNMLALIGSLFLMLQFGQWFGWRLVRPSDAPVSPALPPGFQTQFTLRDLLLWTTAVGALVGVTMHFNPVPLPKQVWEFAVLQGIGSALVATVACYVAWGDRWLGLRLLLLVAVAILAGSAQFQFNGINLITPRWTAAQPSLVAVLATCSLLVFRWHGYRLERRSPTLEVG